MEGYRNQIMLLLELLPLVEETGCFSLKGGTAINLFIRDMPRLSVDIDLTYKFIKSRTDSLTDISIALNKVAETAGRQLPGIRIQKKILGVEQRIHKLFVHREGINIKIEPNEVSRGTVYGVSKMKLSRSVTERFDFMAEITCNSTADIYGSKICAALDRQHPRDLFDIKILFENEGVTDAIRTAFIVYLCSSGRPFEEFLSPNYIDLRNAFENQFRGMSLIPVTLGELESARERLTGEIMASLTDSERQFLYSFSEGLPDWSLLALPEHIPDLPAVKWKLLNIAKMDSEKKRKQLANLKRVLEL